jgi:alanyl-tRNA synthetase
MKSKDILQKYIDFYTSRGHVLIPNVSLVPENDSTLLFVNSGMFPLVPYLSGEAHPQGKRLVNVQRSLRFDDIDNVGNTSRHTIAFHMIGNWSLGDYFKKEQLPWAYQFFVEELGLDINKMYATVFRGDADAPKDEESITILKEIFKKYGVDAQEGSRIFAQGKEDNWWKRGDAIGELGGPDSEVFYYIGKDGNGFGKNPAEHQDEFLEIGNSVFMQYVKSTSGWAELSQKNVDFGGGLERIALVVQNKSDIFETDSFWPIIQQAEKISGKSYYSDEKTKRLLRIVSDHMRVSTFLAMDGVVPSNKDQGYVLRRLLRRMIRVGRSLEIGSNICSSLLPTVVETMSWLYPELVEKQHHIHKLFEEEETKFSKTLDKGSIQVKRFLAKGEFSEETLVKHAFEYFQSMGYPWEIFLEDLNEFGIAVDPKKFEADFKEIFEKHQTHSRRAVFQIVRLMLKFFF